MSDTDTKAVVRKLLEDHQGKHNAITQQQLADATGVTPSTLRSELRRLREERGIPIGNLRDGYFIIQSKAELQEYIGHINREIDSKRQTIKHTTEAWESFDGDTTPDTDEEAPTVECDNCGDSVTQAERRYPEGHDDPVCKSCYGQFLMGGKSFGGNA